jgi:hypothetical protein
MPITIQELIASDTISQAVNKINFNFDQLLLNGGGPVGPQGLPGPTGPVGGRGLRGATWYNDPAVAPGTDPNTLIIPTVEEDDYYLQSNGDVWEYNGTVWVLTSVNLIGPVGPSGSSFGFNYAGGYPGAASINNQNAAYIVPMPGGTSSGANQVTNEGVSVAIFGGVASTAIPPAGISFTNAFLIPDVMTKSLDSSLLSVLIHQKDSASSAIKFMGGGAVLGDKFEQTVFGNLSDISLGVDDTLNINVPKSATSPLSVSDLIGFNLNTLKRGQQFYSGKHINFLSGVDTTSSGLVSEISDITFIVGTSNPSIPAKFAVSTSFGSASALFEVGGNITIPATTTTKTGSILSEADSITHWGNTVLMASSPFNRVRVDSSGILLNSSIGPIDISTTLQNITIAAGLTLNMGASTINQMTFGGDITISTGGSGNIYLESSSVGNSIRIDNTPAAGAYSAVKIKGNLAWGATSYGIPFTTSYKHISISGDGVSSSQFPIIVHRQTTGAVVSPTMATFRKNVAGTPIERVDITTSAVEIYNSSGTNGFVGFRVENSHIANEGTNFGIAVIGRDSVTNAVGPKFHASEDTTAVTNRFQYVRKTFVIDPLLAGITAGGTYTIPSTYMDASFLDIQVLGTSGPAAISPSGNDFNIAIPDGLYPGQRLNLHIISAPARRWDGGSSTQYNWPNIPSGNIGIIASSFAGSSTQLGTITCSRWDTTPTPLAAEFYVELLWIGTTYYTYFNTSSGQTIKSATRGWVVTNLLSPTIGAATPTNTDAQMKCNNQLT